MATEDSGAAPPALTPGPSLEQVLAAVERLERHVTVPARLPPDGLKRNVFLEEELLRTPTIGALVGAVAKASLNYLEMKKDGMAKFKTKRGQDVEFHYATLHEIYRACRPALAEKGVIIVHQLVRQSYNLTSIIHESGEWVASIIPVGTPTDDWKDFGAGLTYARRYGLKGLIAIEPDDDLDAPEGGAGGAPRNAAEGAAARAGARENQGNARASAQERREAENRERVKKANERVRATMTGDNLHAQYLSQLRNRLCANVDSYEGDFVPAVERLQALLLPPEGWTALMRDIDKLPEQGAAGLAGIADQLEDELNREASDAFDGTTPPVAPAAEPDQDPEQPAEPAPEPEQKEAPQGGMNAIRNQMGRAAATAEERERTVAEQDPESEPASPEPAPAAEGDGRQRANPHRLPDGSYGARLIDAEAAVPKVGAEIIVTPRNGKREWPAIVTEVLGHENRHLIVRTTTREKWERDQNQPEPPPEQTPDEPPPEQTDLEEIY